MPEFENCLRKFRDEMKALKDRSAESDAGIPADQPGIIEKVLTLTEQAIKGELQKAEWGREAAPLMLSLGKANVSFDQRNQQAVIQINVGNLTLTQPRSSHPMDPKALSEYEAAFRRRIKDRFEEDSRYYVQLSGQAKEMVVGKTDSKTPRSLKRRLERIEYREWVQEGQQIKKVHLSTLREAVDKYPRVVLLGDPGCGKTTALEHLAYEFAGEPGPLPIPLRLSEFSAGMSVEDFIVNGWAGPESSGHWNALELADSLKVYLESGKLFLLFDALNEMPQEGYRERAASLRQFIDQWSVKGNRFLVACRVLDCGEELSGLQRVEIQPLDDDKIKDFIQRELPARWQDFWAELVKEKNNKRQLLEFARNPYMLTVMIDVFHQDNKLVCNRSELMKRFTEILMARAKEVTPPEKWLDEDILRYALSAMAFEMQDRPHSGTEVKLVLARQLIPERVSLDVNFEPVPVSFDQVLNLAASAHLIEMTGDRSSLRFYHQLLQEYYAAREMLKKESSALTDKWRWPLLEKDMPKWTRPDKNYDLLPPPPPTGWEETTIMAAGLKLENEDQLVLAVNAVNPVLAGRCLHEGRAGVRPAVRKTVVDHLLAAISNPKVALRVRIAAGEVLGYLGDPRIGALVKVPAGKFKMGDNREEHEKPQHELFLEAYQIGKYPVTNAEFLEFVNAGGYKNKRFWTKDGWESRKKDGWVQPRFWDDSSLKQPNRPVVGISWYECLSYCTWKQATTKMPYGLPSEAEWEKAARGIDGRLYPWGKRFESHRLNCAEGDQTVNSTTPVGIYPLGESPYKCMDMAGNVWEWTISLWGKDWKEPEFRYHYRPGDGRENLIADKEIFRVFRGGSYREDQYYARCSCRFRLLPGDLRSRLGFRVVVSLL